MHELNSADSTFFCGIPFPKRNKSTQLMMITVIPGYEETTGFNSLDGFIYLSAIRQKVVTF